MCGAAVVGSPGILLSSWNAATTESGVHAQRIPEEFFSHIARRTGRDLQAKNEVQWLWKNRRVFFYDGTTVTMPDTSANQAGYPQNPSQRPGLGFPIARLGAIFSLSCGAILDIGICRYSGKGQSELGMLRKLMKMFRPGDIMLADRLMCSWAELTALHTLGVDCVVRHSAIRKVDFRCGKRLGKDDQIVSWPKRYPRRREDQAFAAGLPNQLQIRVCRVCIERPGFRSKVLILATTLLDPVKHTKEDLAKLYRERWNAELDLRSIKQTLQMDVLRCKSPDLVRKEIWTHVLVYNLIRTIMAQSAIKHGVQPRSISFKGTLQTLEAFQPMIALQGHYGSTHRMILYEHILNCIASHKVANRPNRFEPRFRKQPVERRNYFIASRDEAKRQMLKRVKKN